MAVAPSAAETAIAIWFLLNRSFIDDPLGVRSQIYRANVKIQLQRPRLDRFIVGPCRK
jgi:hypothetical protein